MLVRLAVLMAVSSVVLGLAPAAPAAPAAGKPDLRIRIIRAGPTVLSLKGQMYAAVLLENRGTADAEQIVFWIRAPKQISIRSASVLGPLGGCYPRGRNWKCEVGGLSPDEAPIEVVAEARAVRKGNGVLHLSVSAHQRDARTADNRRSIKFRVRGGPARADLSVTAEPVGAPQAGVPAQFHFRVRNRGPAAADRITLRAKITSAGWWIGSNFSGSPFDTCGPTDDAQKVVVCTIAFVDAGATADVDLEGYLRLGNVSFDMTVSSKTADPAPRNNSSSLNAAVVPPAKTADLGLSLDVPPHAMVGKRTTITARITNHGPDEAHDVTAAYLVFSENADQPPELVSLTTSSGACSGTACFLGTMAAGKTVTLTLVVVFHSAGRFTVATVTQGSEDAFDPGQWESLPPEQRDSWNGRGEEIVVDGPGQAFSFSRSRSLTTRGFALPPVSFITWPTRNPSSPSLPAR